MCKSNFQRLVALILAFVFVLSGSVIFAGAEDAKQSVALGQPQTEEGNGATSGEEPESDGGNNSSVTDKSIEDVKELMASSKYSEYVIEHSTEIKGEDGTSTYVWNVPKATQSVEVDVINDIDKENSDADYSVNKYDNVEALYTPGDGTVSWKVNVPQTARYSIVVEYYPVEGKPAFIERIFKINGEVPFKEARYLTFSKNWTYDYSITMKEKDNYQDYLDLADKIGISATVSEDKKIITYSLPNGWTQEITSAIDAEGFRMLMADIDNNELRPTMVQSPKWDSYELRDSDGYYKDTFEFVINEGELSLSFTGVNEPMAIKSIKLVPHEDMTSYSTYISNYSDKTVGTSSIKIEAEYPTASSSQTIYPVQDNVSAITSPTAANKTYLNTIGGDKWASPSQWLKYTVKVDESGLYNIVARFRQNTLDGLYTSRALSIYTDYTKEEYIDKFGSDKGYYNGVPFSEATMLRFDFADNWQVSSLTDGNVGENGFSFYFEKDVVYTLEFKVTLGSMSEIISEIETALNKINSDYLNIIKLTGANPDEYRDYGFKRVLADTVYDMVVQSKKIYAIAENIEKNAGIKSSMVATLEQVAWLLDRMGMDPEDEIARNLSQLKGYIGTLGTWLSSAKTQPLKFDYIMVQPVGAELPKANANFFRSFAHEISNFFQSFFRNYNRMGAITEQLDEDSVVDVWLAYGRDQTQVIRSLINNDFTPTTGHAVNLKLVAGGTLLPSILAGSGPDAYIGLGQADVINYAIRGALVEIEDMEGFWDFAIPYEVDERGAYIIDENGNRISNPNAEFNEAAMMVLGIEDANEEFHYYGLPETQSFNMMFVRLDILADLGIDIPKTWDDVLAAIPTLQANNMEIGLVNDYNMFLYQSGGELFADNGMRINLDSNVALESFKTMCNMFTMYSFPYTFDFSNRFRTGEMPIGIANAVGTYNQLKVFATELEGLWQFVPLPGMVDENGNINNVSVSGVSAIVMISGIEEEKKAATWDFMKWHAQADCQTKYSNEMVAIIGPSAKHSTANIKALESLPWTTEEKNQLLLQFNNLASIPNYPGSYIIGRYTSFAFLAAYEDKADPVEELRNYIVTINKEITRKRQEFELETLELGETLAEKRINQVRTIIASDEALEWKGVNYNISDSAKSAQAVLLSKITTALDNADIELLYAASEDIEAMLTNTSLNSEDVAAFTLVAKFLDDAANALKSYLNYN